jgi:hypothetical protein
MGIRDSRVTKLVPATIFTGDPLAEGVRQIYTLKSDTLPVKFVTPESIENPAYGNWPAAPQYGVLLVPGNPELLLAQMDAVVTAQRPGAEDGGYIRAVVPAILARYSEGNSDYRRTEELNESGAYDSTSLQFFYELENTATQEPLFITTARYYHPSASVEVFDLDIFAWVAVTVVRRLGVALVFYPGDYNFRVRLDPFTPTLPWHPAGETGVGLQEVRVYESTTNTPVDISTDWSATLIGVIVPEPS